MVNNSYKTKVQGLIAKAKQKGKIIKYADYCKTGEANIHALNKKDVDYYISNNKEAIK